MASIETRMIPVDRIHPNPNNPRHEAGDVSALSRSIAEEGRVIQALIVVPAPQFGNDHYMIEDGYRRWVAGSKVLRSLECRVVHPRHEEDMAARELFTAIITDVHKEHLSAMERAIAYGRLRDEFMMTQEEIAEKTGLTSSSIGRYLSLLELSDRTRRDVISGKLSVEKAVKAVRDHRAKNREKDGKKPIDVGWEPEHFTKSHSLAKKARVMCDARDHNTRRRLGNVACGQCWETVIRQDQSTVDRVDWSNPHKPVTEVSFIAPVPMPISPDGAIRTDATPSSIRANGNGHGNVT